MQPSWFRLLFVIAATPLLLPELLLNVFVQPVSLKIIQAERFRTHDTAFAPWRLAVTIKWLHDLVFGAGVEEGQQIALGQCPAPGNPDFEPRHVPLQRWIA